MKLTIGSFRFRRSPAADVNSGEIHPYAQKQSKQEQKNSNCKGKYESMSTFAICSFPFQSVCQSRFDWWTDKQW